MVFANFNKSDVKLDKKMQQKTIGGLVFACSQLERQRNKNT
jgi:hypothetical protein